MFVPYDCLHPAFFKSRFEAARLFCHGQQHSSTMTRWSFGTLLQGKPLQSGTTFSTCAFLAGVIAGIASVTSGGRVGSPRRTCRTLPFKLVARSKRVPGSQVHAEPSDNDTLSEHATSSNGNALLDIVQFDSAVYYCEEIENAMSVDVTRLGEMKGEISVDFATEDGSGIAGQRYEAVSGTLRFSPGEVFKTITIPILEGNGWNTTLEFKIRLSNPSNCELGRFLYLCRIKVIDKDTFPTSRYYNEIKQFGAENLEKAGVSGVDLFVEWCKLNLSYDGILPKSLVTLFIDQLQNAYFLFTTYLVKYVADDVLGGKPELPLIVPDSRDQTLLVTAALYVCPLLLLNTLDLWKVQLGIAEKSRSELQANVFRKFMNYDDRSRAAVPPSELSLVIVQDIGDVVDSGFMNLFEIAKNIGKLGVSSYFILSESPEASLPLVVFSVATVAYVSIRYGENVTLREQVSDEQAKILAIVQEASSKYRLVADYFIRPKLQDILEDRLVKLNNATVPVAASGVVSAYFPIWLSSILVTGWIAVGGEGVISGTMQVGTYLATINVFKEVGESFKDIFSATLDLSKAIGPIQKLTVILNLRTNLLDLKKVNRKRRQVTKEERNPENLKELRIRSGQRFGTDAIPIKVKDLTFTYPPGSSSSNAVFSGPVFKDVNLYCEQGDIVGVVGPRRGGKSTFMKLLGQVLLPSEGQLFTPSHLRILHVSSTPMLLSGGLWENLTFGRQYWTDDDFETKRVIRICERIGFQSNLLSLLEDTRGDFLANAKNEDEAWSRVLSTSDLMLIHIARAFIYSPEILVMNRPTQTLSPSAAERTFELLQEFVDSRGIELPAHGMIKRRPRTAFVSFTRLSGVQHANRVWLVKDCSVAQIPKDNLSEMDLA